MTGSELSTFATEVNGGASIGSTFLFQLFNICKALVEQRRPWMVLRSTDTSKAITTRVSDDLCASDPWRLIVSGL